MNRKRKAAFDIQRRKGPQVWVRYNRADTVCDSPDDAALFASSVLNLPVAEWQVLSILRAKSKFCGMSFSYNKPGAELKPLLVEYQPLKLGLLGVNAGDYAWSKR